MMNNSKKVVNSPGINNIFSRLYGNDENTIMNQKSRYKKLLTEFQRYFNSTDVHLFSTPGRTEIGGNHTDHNHGKVLAASVNLDSIAAAAKTLNNKITIYSEGYSDAFIVDLDQLGPKSNEERTTNALIRGITSRFNQLEYNIGGFDACITSEVLPGSGLSSSASVEILIGTILNILYNEGKVSKKSLAIICQYAENVYFKKPCGLMDQIACAVGGIVAIDFNDSQNPDVRRVNFNFDKQNYNILVVNTGGSHADLTEDYASVPNEMKSVAKALGKEVCREINFEDVISNVKSLRSKVGDRAILRALHFLEDNRRVEKQVEALENMDFDLFLNLVTESGSSSCRWLQNCFTNKNVSEQGVTLALALTEKYLSEIGKGACRVHGGGFAGTIQVFLPNEFVDDYMKFMEPIFGKNSILTLRIRPFGTIHLNANW